MLSGVLTGSEGHVDTTFGIGSMMERGCVLPTCE